MGSIHRLLASLRSSGVPRAGTCGEAISRAGCRPQEAKLLAESRVTVIRADAIRLHGARAALRPALEALHGVERVHVHVDMDVLDPTEVRANRYGEPGGLTLEILREALHMVATQHEICSVTLSAYDPAYDNTGHGAEAGLSLLVTLAEAIASRHQG